MIATRVIGFCCMAMLSVACSDRDQPNLAHTVLDSAGLQIVQSHAPRWRTDAVWVVESNSDVDISGRNDDELYRLQAPRVLNNGYLALYNGGMCELRLYDETLTLVSAWGRCGNGPGEFDAFGGIWPWRGDSLLVVDQFPRRASIFDMRGQLGRTQRVPTAPELPLAFVVGVLANGSLVISGPQDPAGRSSPGIEAGQLSLALVRGWTDVPETVGTFPGPLWEYTEWNGRLTRGRLAFSGATAITASASGLFVGFPDRYEIHVFDAEGALERLIRRSYDSVRVTQEDIEWLLDRRLREVDGAENEQIVRRAYRDLNHAEYMPAFGVPSWPGGAVGGPSLLADATGNLWVFEHYRPGEYQNRWTVFSPEGIWLGSVGLPDDLVPSQIGPDFVVGLQTDAEGFVHVRRHRLLKSAGS